MGAMRRGGAADGLCPRCVLARAMATNCDVLRYDKERKSTETRNIPTDRLLARRVPVRQTDRIPQLMKTKMLSTCLLLRLFFALPVMPERVEAADTPTTRANIYDETADGSKQISDALNIAKREDKRVLLQFGANWCGWCHLLHELFESNRIISAKLKADYVVVMIDVNKGHNKDVDTRYGQPTRLGLPVIVVLDSEGKQLTTKNSSELEDGKHHNADKVLAFLTDWERKSLHTAEMSETATPPEHGLKIGPSMLGWSSHKQNPPKRDGYIYMRDQQPDGGNKPLWEFALTTKARLIEVTRDDLRCEFYGMNDPRGPNVFGSAWEGTAILVPEGQVFFARLVADRSVIYAIYLAEQKDSEGGRGAVRVEYNIF